MRAVLVIGVYGSRFSTPAAAVASQLAYSGFGIAGFPLFATATRATLAYMVLFGLMIFTHRSNLVRIINRAENRL